MTRVALYARYSSDLQNERSAEDQLAALRERATARGWEVVKEYADRGISGASLVTRPAVQALLEHAKGDRFDVVLTEALDRLSRGQSDIARLFELLGFYGVRIETLSSGQVSELHVGLEGTMNRMFLVELGKKTRRGLIAKVKEGKSGGGRCYGYRVKEKGVLEPEPAEVAIVERIFTEYDAGRSPRAIAARLNADGIAGPRGGQWTAATINGDRRAQDGILHQELYVGTRVFNRRRFRKHPETGRRSSVLNPTPEWIRETVPELAILDEQLWRRVQTRKAALSETPGPRARRPKRLLSGLLQCGVCNGGMILCGNRYACSSHRERGTCTNTRTIAAATVEARVLEGVKLHLLEPQAVERAVRSFQQSARNEQRTVGTQRSRLTSELAETERRIGRLVSQMEEGAPYSAIRTRMEELTARKAALEAELSSLGNERVYQIHPRAAEHYRVLVEGLAMALEGEDAAEAREAFRGLLDKVVFRPLEGRGRFDLEVHGRLAALLSDEKGRRSDVMVGAGARSIHNVTFAA